MDLVRPVRAFDRYQQEHRWLAIPVAVIKKFSDDQAGGLAALIAYYAFFSIFPLLLVFTTILGFVLQGDPSAQQSIANGVLGKFPIIGDQLKGKQLQGHTVALVIGLLAALWAGLGVTQAAQNAFDKVWAVPFKERPNFLGKRLRGFALVAALGALFIISSLASGLVTGGLGGTALTVAGIAISLLINFALFAAAFRLLTAAAVPTRCLWVGVLVGSVLWEILQAVGGYYIGHVLRHASSTYGFFGLVIGLLAWLHLGAQMTLYAAEINVVLVRRLWPRSLFDPPVPGDEKTLEALAKIEERTDSEKIEVRFEPRTADRERHA
jgi:YihY family inner membrane protein